MNLLNQFKGAGQQVRDNNCVFCLCVAIIINNNDNNNAFLPST